MLRSENFDDLKATPDLHTVDNMHKIYSEFRALNYVGQHKAANALLQRNGLVSLEVRFLIQGLSDTLM